MNKEIPITPSFPTKANSIVVPSSRIDARDTMDVIGK
jgi:hypothetical protein